MLGLVIGVAAPVAFATPAAAASCVGGSLQIVAHEDDDLLFMSPDIVNDAAQHRCIRTVYVTAGDAGRPADYWEGRERGSEAAWAAMAGVADDWSTDEIVAGGQRIRLRTLLGRPSISLVFMRLPNGNTRGEGFDQRGATVYGLLTGRVGTLSARDGSATYTSAELSRTLVDLMRASMPTLVRIQNYTSPYAALARPSFDHYDHIATAKVAFAASTVYGLEEPHHLIAYEGYPIGGRAANVSGQVLVQKLAALTAYAVHDSVVSLDVVKNKYRWPSRQYVVSSTGPQVAAFAGQAQSALVGRTVTLDASGSFAPGQPTYLWAQTGGPASVTLSRAATASATFVPPKPGTYQFRVTVASGATNSQAQVTVVASSVGNLNLAGLEGVSAEASSATGSQTAAAAIDGSILGYPVDATREWATTGGKEGSWLQVTFPRPVATDVVVLHDRPNTRDRIRTCRLSFSDGSAVPCPAPLDDAGGPTTITFPARTTTSIRLTIDGVSSTTGSVGLAEFEAYGRPCGGLVPIAGSRQMPV